MVLFIWFSSHIRRRHNACVFSYDCIKREVTKKRRVRSLVIVAIAVLVIVGVGSVAATLFDSNVDEVMQETGMSKERIETIYDDAGAYMKSAQYNFALVVHKLNST